MDWRRNLLWVDGIAGATVGVTMLATLGWLVDWYHLPRDLLLLVALANAGYGCYSLSLAARAKRPMVLIRVLVIANMFWALLCVRWAIVFGATASDFGLAHLLAEAAFVGGLACLEWRWRALLSAQ